MKQINNSKVKKRETLSSYMSLILEKKEQSGRSMIEILGVLAIGGILSVGSIVWYMLSLDKYRANELLYAANKRATVVAERIIFGNKPSLSEFKDSDFGYAVFDEQVYGESGTSLWGQTDRKFSLQIKGVDESVCQKMQTMLDDVIQGFSPEVCLDNSTVILTYNNNLSTAKIEDIILADCSAYNGTSSANKGGYVGLAADGVTSCNCPIRQKWNVNTGMCEDLGENECGSYVGQECDAGYYCSFDDSASCNNCSDVGGGTCTEGKGICTPLTDGAVVTVKNDGYEGLLTDKQMNWWSANSWCVAHSMKIPSLSEFGCTRDDSKASGWDCDWSRFKVNGRLHASNWWVSDEPDCRARNLNVPNSTVDFDTPRIKRWYSTLCTMGKHQEEVFQQEGESCVTSSDCASGLFCNSANKCQTKLDDGTVCSSSESCKSGYCGQDENGVNRCVTSCTSYDSQECAEGYYCAFNYPRNCTERGTGACMPIINGTYVTEEVDGFAGFYIPKTMNWWSANSLCIAHNKHLISLSEMGCHPDLPNAERNCDDWNKFYKTNGHFRGGVSWWVSDLYTSCVGYNLTTNGARVDHDTHLDNETYYSVVCR